MTTKKDLEIVENIMNSAGFPVYCQPLSQEEVKDKFKTIVPDVLVHMFFKIGSDVEVFSELRKRREEIFQALGKKPFFIKPHTFHYYLTSFLLKDVCPDPNLYYFSPMTGSKSVVSRKDKKILEIELELVLITKGNVDDPEMIFANLYESINSFNISSRYIEIVSLKVATKESPITLPGDSELTFVPLI
jgi:hypothetical protein